jgi:hypothetical protein
MDGASAATWEGSNYPRFVKNGRPDGTRLEQFTAEVAALPASVSEAILQAV